MAAKQLMSVVAAKAAKVSAMQHKPAESSKVAEFSDSNSSRQKFFYGSESS
jgi:hypothetical protein